VFTELRYALGVLPELFINLLQSTVSLRRIAKYLGTQEVSTVQPMHEQDSTIALNSATISWPQERIGSVVTTGTGTPALITSNATSLGGSTAGTPRRKFVLIDLTLNFPQGELSLICGKLGSGKTLLLLALLGEADILTGQLICPRSPADALAAFMQVSSDEDWVLPNMCAYVPQVAWLQNASIKENILFNLPYDEKRYRATVEVRPKRLSLLMTLTFVLGMRVSS
jgi:ABC-type multidrug transport system fused ATPase/permease subunit